MCEPRKVAFFAGQQSHFGPICQSSDFVFDNVLTNVGGAYNAFSGRFTVPVRATYQFNVTISAQEGKKAAFDLMKNGQRVMTIWAESIPTWATSTSVPILSLEAGDQIWVQALSDANLIYGNMYTSFSGFLLCEN